MIGELSGALLAQCLQACLAMIGADLIGREGYAGQGNSSGHGVELYLRTQLAYMRQS